MAGRRSGLPALDTCPQVYLGSSQELVSLAETIWVLITMAESTVGWYRVPGPPFSGTSLQATIDGAIADGGGVVYLPPGIYNLSAPIDIAFDATGTERPITLLGDGPNVTRLVNVLSPLSGPDPLLRIRRSLVSVRGMALDARGLSILAPIRGVVIDGSSGPVSGVELSDIVVRNTSSHALHVVPGTPPNNVRLCRFVRCTFAANVSGGAVRIESGASGHEFLDCHINFFGGSGLDLAGCERVVFQNGAIEAPNNVGALDPYVRSRGARDCHLVNVWFEEPTGVTASPWFVDLEPGSDGWTIAGCYFVRSTSVGGVVRAIRVGSAAGPCRGVSIVNPYVRRVPTGVPTSDHIEIGHSDSECVVAGGIVEAGFGGSIVRYPIEVADASSKSVWIGHRRWRAPTLNNSEVNAITANRHHGDIMVRLGQGVHAFSGLGSTWIPMSVNRVPNESVMNGISVSAKDKGTMVWVDTPNGANSHLRVYNGTDWNQVSLT